MHTYMHAYIQGSVKLRVLVKLVRRLQLAEHRMLIFSQSKLMLDIIQVRAVAAAVVVVVVVVVVVAVAATALSPNTFRRHVVPAAS